MMPTIKEFDIGALESIAKVLGDTDNGFTGSEISRLLDEADIPDPWPTATKWKRLLEALRQKQERDRCANNVCGFIQMAMNPARHLDNHEWFSSTRYDINKILSFEGLSLGEDGKIARSRKVATINEATARASKLRESLVSRNAHPDVFEFCKEELLVDHYFHAVFEATKSVAEKIRSKTGLTSDGAPLVDEAFSFKSSVPHLALNTLHTESERSEQKGFVNLLKGLFGTFRNPPGHAPRITWPIDEQDALDILSLVSLIHRRLDNAVESPKYVQATHPPEIACD